MKAVNISRRIVHSSVLVLNVFLSARATAQESYSPYAGQHYPTTVYWGDTHLHTSLSADAYAFGARLGSAEAYRFSRGESLTASNGMRAQLRRPLDFLVVADHAESIGVMTGLEVRDPVLLRTQTAKRMLSRFEETAGRQPTDPETLKTLIMMWKLMWTFGKKRPDIDQAFMRSVWNQVTDAADHHDDPGRFTALLPTMDVGFTPLPRTVELSSISSV